MSSQKYSIHFKICSTRVKEEGISPPALPAIPCPFCDLEVKSKEVLGQHLRQREKQRCPEKNCPQLFCESADYKKHIKTTHYQCLR